MKNNQTNRRAFFKTSALGALGTVSVPAFLGGCSNSASKTEKLRESLKFVNKPPMVSR